MEELKKQASDLRKAGKYVEAIEIFDSLWKSQQDKWVGWEYALCLNKSQNNRTALQIVQQVYKIAPDFNYNNNLYAWILNDLFFKETKTVYTNEESNDLLEKALLICSLVKQNDSKSPVEFCVLRAIKIAKRTLPKLPSEKIIDLLAYLDVNLLSTKNYEVEIKGRSQEMQSNKEFYYSIKTKTLFDLERYEECLSCCEEALANIESFHHNNNIWIEERKTQCIASLGNVDAAISILSNLVLHKDSWFLLSELGELYYFSKDNSKALLYFCRAAITRDPIEMKVTLFEKMGDLLTELSHVEIAQKHYVFAKTIRGSKDWQIPYRLSDKINNENQTVDKKDLLQFWEDTIFNTLGVNIGKIQRLSPNGKTGFIVSSQGSYFFKLSNIRGRSNAKINDNVKFAVTESFDTKKNEASVEANYICIL